MALYCTKTDGFPENKEAGVPCKQLMPDFRCRIHSMLAKKGMKGCLAYDCFGAGQKVTQGIYANEDWKKNPEKATEICRVFMMVFQLHQMIWYLLEALSLVTDESERRKFHDLMAAGRQLTTLPVEEMLKVDLTAYHGKVNQVLKQVSSRIASVSSKKANNSDYFGKNFKKSNLNGRDFSMAIMVAANLEGCSLKGTNFLGADLRDANIKNTDLSEAVFLTQMQVNATLGNSNTKLPTTISRPAVW
ncbi:pentapeptide repeat-containing protein [Anoxynatronum buryatiense]|nr:pentapeptide repeat-containing protein [Anoxynatronum buryatiense]